MKKYAVLIGNSKFPDELDKENLKDLHCPENDVDGLGKVLASERGEFDVLPLKNQPSHKILRELQRKVKQAEADDLLLLYYAGHGKPNKAGILHLTTFDTVLAELESSAISINRVYEILDTAKCKKVVILLDCCFSGAAKDGFRGTIDDKLQQLNNSRGTYLITASTKEQLAYESVAEGYGLFTKHLIAGLETGEADKDGDGWVSMNELYDYVQRKVVAENPAQQPTKHVKEERGGLFIIKSGRDYRKEQTERIERYIYDLAREKRISKDILLKALELLEKTESQFSTIEVQQYLLMTAVFERKIEPVEFVRKWDRLLTFEIEKAAPKKLEQAKQERERLRNGTETSKSAENLPEKKFTWKKYLAVILLFVVGLYQFIGKETLVPTPTVPDVSATVPPVVISEPKVILPATKLVVAANVDAKAKQQAEAMVRKGETYLRNKNYKLACESFKQARDAGNADGKEYFEKVKKCSKYL